jgi:hypothetical protein
LRALCDSDVRSNFQQSSRSFKTDSGEFLDLQCGLPLLLDRLKQSMTSCRVSFAVFLSLSTRKTRA